MAGEEQTAHAATTGGHGLTKKLGPLPIWAWAAVLVGSYLLYHYLKNRNSNTGAVSTVGGTATGSNNAPVGGLQIGPAGQIYDPTTGTIVGSVGGTTSTSTGSNTNTAQGWLAAAQTALQGLGLDNNTINSALNNYVAGQPLQQSEYNIVEEAIKIIGAAPAALGNPALAPVPAPGTPAPGPTGQSAVLPQINAQLYPLTVLWGQYGPNDYTKVGSFTNGQYQGYNVSGGAPVYLGAYGGFVQDFQTSTATGDVYVPTSLLPYVVGYPGNTSHVSPAGTTTRAAA